MSASAWESPHHGGSFDCVLPDLQYPCGCVSLYHWCLPARVRARSLCVCTNHSNSTLTRPAQEWNHACVIRLIYYICVFYHFYEAYICPARLCVHLSGVTPDVSFVFLQSIILIIISYLLYSRFRTRRSILQVIEEYPSMVVGGAAAVGDGGTASRDQRRRASPPSAPCASMLALLLVDLIPLAGRSAQACASGQRRRPSMPAARPAQASAAARPSSVDTCSRPASGQSHHQMKQARRRVCCSSAPASGPC